MLCTRFSSVGYFASQQQWVAAERPLLMLITWKSLCLHLSQDSYLFCSGWEEALPSWGSPPLSSGCSLSPQTGEVLFPPCPFLCSVMLGWSCGWLAVCWVSLGLVITARAGFWVKPCGLSVSLLLWMLLWALAVPSLSDERDVRKSPPVSFSGV